MIFQAESRIPAQFDPLAPSFVTGSSRLHPLDGGYTPAPIPFLKDTVIGKSRAMKAQIRPIFNN